MNNKKTIPGSLDDKALYMADPVVVERADLERIADAFGEIGVHLPWLREQVGPCADEVTCVMEAQIEGAGLVRRALGKYFNSDRSFVEEIVDALAPQKEGVES